MKIKGKRPAPCCHREQPDWYRQSGCGRPPLYLVYRPYYSRDVSGGQKLKGLYGKMKRESWGNLSHIRKIPEEQIKSKGRI